MRRVVLTLGAVLVVAGIGLLLVRLIGSDDPSDALSVPTSSSPPTESDDESPSSTAGGATARGDAAGGLDPAFEQSRCAFQVPLGVAVECGYVTVPEDRQDPDGPTIRLHAAVFPSRADEPAADPVVYLEGGPGGEPLDTLQFGFEERFGPILGIRDLVIFDQRGTGWAEPTLNCPAYRQLGFDLLDERLDADEYVARERAVLDECRNEWSALGIDLTDYNSAENAADVDDLREALGYDSWNLYGISYGTRLALTVMRDHPEGVRAVVLDSTYPPEVDGIVDFAANARRAFDRLFSSCAADSACTAAYGDLEQRLFALVDRWNADPVDVTVVDYLAGGQYPAVVDGDDLLGIVFQALYSESLIPSIPQIIDEADRGEMGLLAQTLSLFIANGEFFSPGMYFSVQCNEEVPFADRAAYEPSQAGLPYMAALADGTIIQSDRSFEFCQSWGSGVADAIENEPVDSDIPTLVMAGVYDPITPPADGRAVAERLGNATFVEFEGLGHGVSSADPCPTEIMLAFLDDPGRDLDTACSDQLGPPRWVVPRGAGERLPDVELVEFSTEGLGLAFGGVAPVGWDEQFPGAYARAATGLDQTALVMQAYPGELSALVGQSVLATLDLDRETEDLPPFDDGTRRWAWMRNATDGFEIDVMIVDHDGSTLLLMLISDPADRDQLVEQLLQPAAAAMHVTR